MLHDPTPYPGFSRYTCLDGITLSGVHLWMCFAASGEIIVTAGVLRIASHSLIVASRNLGHSESGILLRGNSCVLLTAIALKPVKLSCS